VSSDRRAGRAGERDATTARSSEQGKLAGDGAGCRIGAAPDDEVGHGAVKRTVAVRGRRSVRRSRRRGAAAWWRNRGDAWARHGIARGVAVPRCGEDTEARARGRCLA
jgi:hypothetical protein